MAQFYTLLTDVGQAKLANAVALGQTIEITELAVGDGGGSLPTPDSGATALINEVRRAPINTSTTDPDNPSWIVVEQVLPPDVGGWTIREIGIYDVDGDLIGIGNYPETYKPVLAEGSSRTQTVRFVLEVSDTAAVTLKVDPSVVLATREYVDGQRAEHEASRNHPSATDSEKGMVQLATIAEAQAMASLTKALTPRRLADAFKGGNQSLTEDGFQILPGGLIIQAGKNGVVMQTTKTVTLPIPFPAGVMGIVATKGSNMSTIGELGISVNSGLDSFDVTNSMESGSQEQGFSWIALGW